MLSPVLHDLHLQLESVVGLSVLVVRVLLDYRTAADIAFPEIADHVPALDA